MRIAPAPCVLFSVAAVFLLTLVPAAPAFALTSDLNQNGISDQNETDVIASTTQTLPAGSYTFHNLTIAGNAVITVQGDSAASGFKGVQVTADNLTITSSAGISADGQGYTSDGPGSSTNFSGGSYGGVGEGSDTNKTYGSAMQPTEIHDDVKQVFHLIVAALSRQSAS